MASILAEIIMLVIDVAAESSRNNNRYNRNKKRSRNQEIPFAPTPWNSTRVNSTSMHQSQSIKNDTILSSNTGTSNSSVSTTVPSRDALRAVERKVVVPVVAASAVTIEKPASVVNKPTPVIEKPVAVQKVKIEVEKEEHRTLSTPTLSKPHYSTKKDEFNVNRVKLEVLLLSYIYIEDDGKISFSEKTKLKTHFKSFKDKLDEEDLESIQGLMVMEPSLDNIRAHVNQNEMDDAEVNDILDSIQTMCGMNKDYREIMRRIRASLQNTINH